MYRENKIVAGVVFLVFAAAFAMAVATIAGTAKLFPICACIIGMLFSACLFLNTCYNEKKGIPMAQSKKNSKTDNVKTTVAFLMVTAYSVLISVIGWCVSSLLFMAAFVLYFGDSKQKKLKTLLITVVTVAVLYVLFAVAMSIVLPSGLLI